MLARHIRKQWKFARPGRQMQPLLVHSDCEVRTGISGLRLLLCPPTLCRLPPVGKVSMVHPSCICCPARSRCVIPLHLNYGCGCL